MKLTSITRKYKMVKPGDDKFTFTEGLLSVNRASIMVDATCPADEKYALQRAIRLGWLTPVAYVRDEELMWELLQEEH